MDKSGCYEIISFQPTKRSTPHTVQLLRIQKTIPNRAWLRQWTGIEILSAVIIKQDERGR